MLLHDMDRFAPTPISRNNPLLRAFFGCWLGTVCVLSSGCRTPTDYRAANLPLELRADKGHSSKSFDLSSIAQQSINKDLIYPGDVLQVTVATGIEENEPHTWPLRVSDQGLIEVPLVGPVRLAGLNLLQAEREIRRVSIERDIYRRPHVSVLMQQRRMIFVRVVGAVKNPGVHELPAAGSDLLAALVAAGGLSENAGTLVELRHPNSTRSYLRSERFEGVALASFEKSADIPTRSLQIDLSDDQAMSGELDLHVEDGSVIMIPEKPSHSISVIGLVKRPDNYALPPDETLRVLGAIALAGGRRVSVADRVRVIRQRSDGEDPIVIAVSIKSAKRNGKENLILAAGDTVSVEDTAATFLVETVQSFIRFGFTSAIPGF